jgi:predicted GIY-YIG superfamily endonuclease
MSRKATKHILIYKITNIINRKFYIGSTEDYFKRRQNHKYNLRHNCHPNQYLQSSFNKHGETNFIFEIVEYCEITNLIEREQYCLDLYQTYNNKIGYNLSPTAGRTTGIICSEETKSKIGKANKERYKNGFSEEHIKNIKLNHNPCPKYFKTVYQYDKDLNLIKIWNSGAEISKFYGINLGAISKLVTLNRIVESKKSKLKGYQFSRIELVQNKQE